MKALPVSASNSGSNLSNRDYSEKPHWDSLRSLRGQFVGYFLVRNGMEYRLERSLYQLIWLELELEIQFCRYEV